VLQLRRRGQHQERLRVGRAWARAMNAMCGLVGRDYSVAVTGDVAQGCVEVGVHRLGAAGRRRSWRWPVAPHAGSTYVPNVPLLLPTAAFGALHPTLAASGTTIHCTSGMSGWHERHTDLFTTRLEI
jgi:hypothetical protein